MANWYVNSVAYAAVPVWAASHTYAAASIVRQVSPVTGNERCFRTVAGGVSGATEPIWNTTAGGVTVADNTVTDWTEVSGNQTYQAPGAWSAPLGRLPRQGATAATLNANGTGYAIGDLLRFGGAGHCIVKVTAVATGHPTGSVIYDPGVYAGAADAASAATTALTGVGSACTIATSVIGAIRGAASDTFFISSNHAETSSGNPIHIWFPGIPGNPTNVICVDETGAGNVPPQSTNLKKTAAVTDTGTGGFQMMKLAGSFYCYGVAFSFQQPFNTVVNASCVFSL